MFKTFAIAAALAFGLAGASHAQTCPSATYVPNTFTNGATADASQVNANFTGLLTCANNLLAPLASPHFTGNVGIGTTTPSTALVVSTNAYPATVISGTSGAVGVRMINNTYSPGNYWDWADDSVGGLTADHNGTDIFWIGRAGGNSAQFAGLLYATGFLVPSDAQLKENIKALNPGALGIIQKLRPVSFDWKRATDASMRGEQIGFIAQEVQKVLPAVVLTHNNGKSAENTMAINYAEIIPVLTKAIQEQQAEIEALKAEVAAMKSSH